LAEFDVIWTGIIRLRPWASRPPARKDGVADQPEVGDAGARVPAVPEGCLGEAAGHALRPVCEGFEGQGAAVGTQIL